MAQSQTQWLVSSLCPIQNDDDIQWSERTAEFIHNRCEEWIWILFLLSFVSWLDVCVQLNQTVTFLSFICFTWSTTSVQDCLKDEEEKSEETTLFFFFPLTVSMWPLRIVLPPTAAKSSSWRRRITLFYKNTVLLSQSGSPSRYRHQLA